MGITVLGIIWIILLFINFGNLENIITLTVVSIVFQKVAFIYTDNSVLTLFDLSAIFLIFLYIFHYKQVKINKNGKLLLIFLAITYIGSFISSLLFRNYQIFKFEAYNGVYYNPHYETIVYNGSLYIALIRLTLQLFSYLVIVDWTRRNSLKKIQLLKKIVYASLVIVLAFGIIQCLGTIGVYVDPIMKLVHTKAMSASDAYYDNYSKLFSTFSEPSYCGPWLNSMLWAIYNTNLIEPKKNKYLVLMVIFVELVLSMSATAIVGFAFMLLLQYKSNIQKLSKKKMIIILLSIIFLFIFGFITPVGRKVAFEVINKRSSNSGIIRMTSTLFGYKTIIKTFGLGLGFNQIVSYTLIGGLAAQTGVIATLVFLAFNIRLLRQKNYSQEVKFSNIFFISSFFCTEISSSGLLYASPYWYALMISAICSKNKLHTHEVRSYDA